MRLVLVSGLGRCGNSRTRLRVVSPFADQCSRQRPHATIGRVTGSDTSSPTDCSDTFARLAASATVISPARIESTIRTFSSAGNTGGLAVTIRLLDGQTRKKRALPGILGAR
jgi:hypothetical protein